MVSSRWFSFGAFVGFFFSLFKKIPRGEEGVGGLFFGGFGLVQ